MTSSKTVEEASQIYGGELTIMDTEAKCEGNMQKVASCNISEVDSTQGSEGE